MDYTIRLMKPEEYNFAYTQKQEIMDDSACIGHLRVDMGSNGKGFFTSWDDHRPELKSPEFKAEFDVLINTLRENRDNGCFMKDRDSLKKFCYKFPESKITDDGREFGFRVDTDDYAYMLRLNPNRGEYAAYVYAYERDLLDFYLVPTQEVEHEAPFEKMTILVVEPEKPPYIKEINPGLESLQAEVDGYIEAIYPYEDSVAVICNEEGKLNGLPLNRALRDEDGRPYDILAGTFIVTGLGEEDFCSLTQEQCDKFSKQFQTPEMFLKINGKLIVLPMDPPPEKKPSVKEKLAKASPQKEKKPSTKNHDKGAR